MQGMQTGHTQAIAKVMGHQGETKTKDEQERATVADKINGFYQQTKTAVESSLSNLDQEVKQKFDAGAAAAKQKFENFVAPHMVTYKKRYDGPEGWLRWAKDKLLGVPPEVSAFFGQGRQLYIGEMDKTLDEIANYVTSKLNEAKQRIDSGKQQIQSYVQSLPSHLKQVGQEAAQNIQSQFDTLEQTVNQKQDALIDSLAQRYNENLQQLDAQLEEMKASNRSWLDGALSGITDTIKTITELKNMLLGVLAKAAGSIEKIIKDPIGFLGNLVAGIKQGIQGFVGNIGTHLKKGLIGWLTGALGDSGVQMPASFDLKGIFALVMEVLGVTYAGMRSQVAAKVGEKKVNALDRANAYVS